MFVMCVARLCERVESYVCSMCVLRRLCNVCLHMYGCVVLFQHRISLNVPLGLCGVTSVTPFLPAASRLPDRACLGVLAGGNVQEAAGEGIDFSLTALTSV